jgi:hypothetical protein
MGATAEKRVEVRLLGTVMMRLAWFGGISVLRRLSRTEPLGSSGVRRNVLQDESSRRRGRRDARRKTRFSAVLTTGFERFPLLPVARKLFPESGPRHENAFDAMRDVGGRVANRVAKYGRGEICCEPWVTGLARQRAESAQRRVSIGKKTVGRALRASV